MVNLRRFGPLIGVFLFSLAVLVARLWDVQVREHDVWAREAANLVRSWFIEPYTRGRILDREGRELVRDVEGYELEFVWRDFRRGHPLGQVASLRSLAVGRPVSLEETRQSLSPWAQEFVTLSPADVDEFGRGGSLTLGGLQIPSVGGEGREQRRRAREQRRGSRSGDIHFYIKALLHPSRRASLQLPRSRGDAGWERPYVELVAEAEGMATSQDLFDRLQSEIRASQAHLDRLAEKVPLDSESLSPGIASIRAPEDRLVALIEDTRREVEFEIADDLFRQAAGFDPTRLDEENLSRLDLDWLRRSLGWDEARLASWRGERGKAWGRAVNEYLSGYAISRAKLSGRQDTWPQDRVLSALAYPFNGDSRRTVSGSAVPRPWWEVDQLVVLTDLPGHLAGGSLLAGQADEPVLPFQGMDLDVGDPALLERALRGAFPTPVGGDPVAVVREAADTMVQAAMGGGREWRAGQDEPFALVLAHWNQALQARVAELFDRLPQPVALDGEWIDIANKARAYVVRDRGARPVRIGKKPSYELVRLVTRHPERYAGFHVRAITERQSKRFLSTASGRPMLDEDGQEIPIAEKLIGKVRPPAVLDILDQRDDQLELRGMQSKLVLPEEDRGKILEIAGDAWQDGTVSGANGVEAMLDGSLRGRNGYRESTGLQDRRDGNRQPIYEEPVDGQDVGLTLNIELQGVAQELLENPGPPEDGEDRPDRVWHEYPVGAIVLATVEGDVIVAASGPSRGGYEPGPGTVDEQRRYNLERTLRMHTFLPPGSVIKPLVAAWALDGGWIGPEWRGSCENLGGKGLGSHRLGETVRCHSVHGGLKLHGALTQSCNAYFAQIGESHFTGQGVRDLARTFGLGEPTGIRDLGPKFSGSLGVGLPEDFRPNAEIWRRDDVEPGDFMAACLANGLAYVSATPMQIVRAYAGLATGRLPRMRLVESVGDQVVPRASEPLGLSPGALDTVRSMLADVPLEGSARDKGLDEETLGFTLACKTGSADYQRGLVPVNPAGPIDSARKDGMRKHAWVAGWFPAEQPRYAVVVFVHDTSTTSSRIATYMLSRFLQRPEVKDWLAERGVGRP